jgi:hypothetical protein
MSTPDRADDGGFLARLLRRITRQPSPADCDHPHARELPDDRGEPATVLVCERCGEPLDASDPTLRRSARLQESRVCVDCGGTYWTTGVRRTL